MEDIAAPTKAEKGHLRVASHHSLSHIKCKAVGLINGEHFSVETTVSRTTRGRLLKKVETSWRLEIIPPLIEIHVQKRLKWAENNMNVDFSKILFTDKSRATIDVPNSCSKG